VQRPAKWWVYENIVRQLLVDSGTKYKVKPLAHRPIMAHCMIAL
jgi:hypothetical protein